MSRLLGLVRSSHPLHSHISVGPDGQSSLTGERSNHPRAKQLFNLVLPLQHMLPSHVDIHVSDHDLGSWILGDDQRDLALTRIQTAMREDLTGLNSVKFLTPNELKRLENRKRNGHPGWFVSGAEFRGDIRRLTVTAQSACPETSPARGHDRDMENRRREMDGLDPLPEPESEPCHLN